jgi:putative transcriptional regulator
MKVKFKKTKYPGERHLTDAEVLAAARSDLGNRPATATELRRARQVPAVKRLRWQLDLTQEAFAERYGIPLATLRDWEQGRTEPDAAVQSYLKIIESEPKKVAKILDAAE